MIAEALTLAKNFGPWFAGVGVASLVLGGYGGFAAGKLVYVGRADRAEKVLVEYKAETAAAIGDAARLQIPIRDEVSRSLHAQRISITSLATDVRGLRRDVSLCTSLSSMRVPGPTSGAREEAVGGEPRPAADVLQDIAAATAERADSNASEHNALIDWLEATRAGTVSKLKE